MFVELGPAHERDLVGFPCTRFGQPSTRLAEEMIREALTDELAAGWVSAFGIFEQSVLVGLAAYRPEGDGVLRVPVLAVRASHSRRGHGLALKAEVLARARQLGCDTVLSSVHRDNKAMWEINRRLGAVFRPDPQDPSRTWFLCLIEVEV
jgi:GNAT superfamily N-acetyltransferase